MFEFLIFVFDFSVEYRIIDFVCARGDVCSVTVLYGCVEMSSCRVNGVVVCTLEVLLLIFHCGGKTVPVNSVLVSI